MIESIVNKMQKAAAAAAKAVHRAKLTLEGSYNYTGADTVLKVETAMKKKEKNGRQAGVK